MNKIMKKIYLSVLTLGLTVVALGTTTFAWFTLTNIATVQQFEVEVQSDEGLEMRLNFTGAPATPGAPSNWEDRWSPNLSTTAMTEYIEAMYPDFQLRGVTSTDGINFTVLGGDAATVGFLEIVIDFRSNNITEVEWSEVSLASTGVSFTPEVDFLTTRDAVDAGQTIGGQFFAANATRISVTGTETVVYELEGEDFGESVAAYGDNTYLGGLGEYNAEVDDDDNDLYPGAISFFKAQTGDYPEGADDISVVATLDTIDGQKVLDLTTIPNFGQTYGGTLTIRVWIEGWDPDMYNAILEDKIQISLTFTGIIPTP